MARALAATVATRVRAVAIRRERSDVDHVLRAAVAAMHSVPYCVLTCRDGAGIHAATMEHRGPDRDLRVHLGASPRSRKARLLREGSATLVFTHQRDRACVVAHCDVTMLDDAASRERWFAPTWRAFWPDGPHDDFVVARLEPTRLEVWDLRRRVTPAPFGLASARLEKEDGTWTTTAR